MLDLRSKEVKRFWHAARQHYEVARTLAEFGGDKAFRSVGAYHAVYIGGYAVECGLKALYLSRVPVPRQAAEIDGRLKDLGHNLIGLSESIATRFGVAMPRDVRVRFRERVAPGWDVTMRYYAGQRSRRDAEEFLGAVKAVLDWIDGSGHGKPQT